MLSIVITTYNRPEHLRRLLRYFRNAGVRHSIYLGDASAPASFELNAALARSLADWMDIRHIVMDISTDYFEVLYRCLEEVETEFVIHMADDDFIVPSSMELGVEFLRRNPDYESVQGRQVLFSTVSDAPCSSIRRVRPLNMVDFTVKGKSALERIRARISQKTRLPAPKTVYSAMRTKTALRLYREALALGLDHSNTEGTMNQMVMLAGNIKLMNRLYIARQYHRDNAAQRAAYNYVPVITRPERGEALPAVTDMRKDEKAGTPPDFFDLLIDPLAHVKYARKVECLARELAVRDGMGMDAARSAVKAWEWHFIAKNMMPKFHEHGLESLFTGASVRDGVFNSIRRRLGSIWKDKSAIAALMRPGAGFISGFMPICRAVRGAAKSAG